MGISRPKKSGPVEVTAPTIHCRLTLDNALMLTLNKSRNPMVEDQALDRVYRIGQTKPVTTVRYIVKGTLEEVYPDFRLTKFQSSS